MIFQDLLYALRQFRNNPNFAVVSILSIALGIGSSTAIFGAVYSVLLHPFPFAGADRMVHVAIIDKAGDLSFVQLTGSQLLELDKAQIFESILVREYADLSLTGGATPESVRSWALSPNAFEFFGLDALIGHGFTESDARFGEDPNRVVVLGYRFWRTHYSSRKDVVGRTLELNQKAYTIIGVAPERFWSSSDIYLPLRLDGDPTHTYLVDAKLKSHASSEVSTARLESLLRQFARETPADFPIQFKANLPSWIDLGVGRLSNRLFVLFGAVSLLLFIGCMNAAILLLARGVSRQAEIGTRLALGATRSRIVRQLLTESLLISSSALIPGVLFSYIGIHVIRRWLPEGLLPSSVELGINFPVLIFACLVAAAAPALFGLFPSLTLSRSQISGMLHAGSRSTSQSSRRMHELLIAGQVGISVLLLAGAGTALRTLVTLYHSHLGYDPTNILIAGVTIDKVQHHDWAERIAYFDQIKTTVSETPGIKSVALTYLPLPPVSSWQSNFQIEGTSASQGRQEVALEMVSPEFFKTVGISILQGHVWTESQSVQAAAVALVNQTMARRFKSGDALGQLVRVDNLEPANAYQMDVDDPVYAPGNNGSVEIVGVVADTPNNGLREPILPTIYVPFTLATPKFLQLVVKTVSPPLANVRVIRQRIGSVNSSQSINEIRTAEDKLDLEGWAQERLLAIILAILAVLALFISAVGLYSVIVYTVSDRYVEFGIRLALGASRPNVIWTVVVSIAASMMAGLLLGIIASAVLGSLIAKWTGVNVSDPIVLTVVATAVGLIGSTAALIPARRAASITPVEALRAD